MLFLLHLNDALKITYETYFRRKIAKKRFSELILSTNVQNLLSSDAYIFFFQD